MERKSIVVVGSINMDMVANAARIPLAGETISGDGFATHPGGKGANQAVAAGRLGAAVKMIGRVGEDAFAAELRASLEGAGVDTSGVKSVAGSSGVAAIVVAASGENCIVVVPGANGTLRPEDLDEHVETIRSAGAVLAQLEIPPETVKRLAEMCHEAKVPFVLDPAPARELPRSLLKLVTWFTPNETEAAFYAQGTQAGDDAENIAQALLMLGVKNVVLKRGSEGFLLATAGGSLEVHPAYTVTAVDTTAAGDAFNGAFAMALVSGKTPVESSRFAAAAAAVSVTRRGAQPSMATLEEVDEFLAELPS
ncbi:ribokinase [Granulicella aggregans]|uniref:Ribokinase n=1 Tax=Granulicella aggregans TaxID=474949 RepID=A0A7W7ZHJ3_9BACT|nr:ribokinase [Granulicella aggregans]MBB5059967.1 ribokinase [Granulicella aggregans]